MNHPGVWIMGDLADDDRMHGMGIVVEYAGRRESRNGSRRSRSRGTTRTSANSGAAAPSPDEVFDMLFAKQNAAADGFNRWTINDSRVPRRRTHASNVSAEAGQALSAAHAQRQRRHPSYSPAPPQLRADAFRRQADVRRDEGRGDGRRIPGDGDRFRSR